MGSKVGIGLDPDGFSLSLDLMKTVWVFGFGEEPSEGLSLIGKPTDEDLEKYPAVHLTGPNGWDPSALDYTPIW